MIQREGSEVVITEYDQPVARLLPAAGEPQRKPRQPGTLRGTVLSMAPDFDTPLDDFKEYMEYRERGRLRAAKKLVADFDLLIGVTARQHGLTLLTNNRHHFALLEGLVLESSK